MNERYRRSRQRLLAIGIMAVVLGALIVTLSAAEELWRTDDADPLTTLEPGTDPDADLLAGETRLMVAAEWGDLEQVSALLAAGARVNQRDAEGYTPLLAAVAGRPGRAGFSARRPWPQYETYPDRADLLRLLIDKGARVNVRSRAVRLRRDSSGRRPPPGYGLTPLGIACEVGDAASVSVLLEAGAKPNRRSQYWRATPLLIAVRSGRLECVSLLLQAGAKVNAKVKGGGAALTYAKRSEMQQMLLAGGADVRKAFPDLDAALLSRAAAGDLPIVQRLLTNGADPNAKKPDGLTALMLACIWRDSIGDVLLTGHDPDQQLGILRALLAAGAESDVVDREGRTALIWAAAWDRTALVAALLAAGARPDIADHARRTALTWAARRGPENETAKLLLEHGGKVDLTSALLLGWSEVARRLLQRGADDSIPGPFSETPLMIAAEHGDVALVRALLDKGAKVRAEDKDGLTALIVAVAGRPARSIPGFFPYYPDQQLTPERLQVVRLLLDHGADPQHASETHFSAIGIAKDLKAASFIQAMIEHDKG